MKPAVVFIHGFNKKSEYWNKNEFNKDINIEKIISKKAHTLLIQVDDYLINPKIAVIPIIEQMKLSEQKKWTIVCHSLGILYGLELLNYDIQINGVCLVDPSTLDNTFIEKITNRGWTEIAEYCTTVKYNPSPKIIFHIHLEYREDKQNRLARQIRFFKQFTGKNDKSKIIIHPNKGHMIHYTDAPKIISSILSIVSQ